MVIVSKHYRPWNPAQAFLLPPSPMDWLPEGHLAYFVLDVVSALDLSSIEGAIAAKDARGERPYAPRMLLGLLVYGYCVGVFSSRKIAKATYDDVAFRVLGGGEHPHFTTISAFRLEHREHLAGLFVQILRLCERAGLVKLGHVSLDGTKILANASKHKAMSYERMQKDEARLQAEVEALFALADAKDREEDQRLGVGKAQLDLPEELERRQSRLDRIRAAKQELENEAAQVRAQELRQAAAIQQRKADDANVDPVERRRASTRATKARERAVDLDGESDDDDQDNDGPGAHAELPSHRVATTTDGKPHGKAQRNFTDPDSRIMVSGGTFVQAFNAQAVVDEHAQIIVAEAVTNQPPDAEHLPAMMRLTKENTGRAPERLSADCGYCSDANIDSCGAERIEPYLAVARDKHSASMKASTAPQLPATPRDLMKAKLDSSDGRAIYSRRKVIVEPVFGQIKGARGFRRFSLRGIDKVRSEWSFVCLTHKLLKLFRFGGRLAPLVA